MLINPRRRRKARKTVHHTKRRRNPAPRRRRRSHTTALVAAPRRRMRRRHNPISRVHRRIHRRRRNPISRIGLMETAKPALQGAAGALILDVLMGMAPIPASFKTGPMRHLVKALGAVGIGMLAKNLTGSQMAGHMALGAMTVTFHDAGREILSNTGVRLGEVGEVGYYSPGMSEFMPYKSSDTPDYDYGSGMHTEMNEYVY